MDVTDNIVVLDAYVSNAGDMHWDALQRLAPCKMWDRTAPSEVVERAAQATIVLTNKVCIDEPLMAQLPHLRYIGVMATGYNIVDVAAACRRGIVVTNVPAYSTASVAQLTIAHLLNISCQVHHYALESRQGVWSRNPDFSYVNTAVFEMAGKTLGIVGLGQIGSAVARIALAMGMRVQALTSKSPQTLAAMGVTAAPSLQHLLATSDVVSLHCPLTAANRHVIDAAALACMKPTAILLNTSRGPLVDEAALAHALRTGGIMAAGIDVMEQEPPRLDNELLQLSNCYVTPHIGWATTEARQRMMDIIVANVAAFLSGHPINVLIN